MGVVHRDVHGFRRLGTGAIELDQDVQGVQVEPAVHVRAHLELAAARLLLRGAAHVEIVRGHVGALDAARDGRGRDAVLIGDEGVRAQEPAELGAGERARRPQIVSGREAVRVFSRVVEARHVRVVARPLDVAAKSLWKLAARMPWPTSCSPLRANPESCQPEFSTSPSGLLQSSASR